MFARITRSWSLVKASATVLAQDTELLLFPLMSLAAAAMVAACFIAPMIGLGLLDGITHRRAFSSGLYALAFLFYFSQYFVAFFFNTALVGAAMIRLDGGNPTLGDGLRIATSKIGAIAGYALIAATVGIVLRAIQERVGFIGRIIVGFLGVGWTIATFLVVPVLVTRDTGPIEAIRESAALLKKTWGENVIGQVGLAASFGFIYLAVMLGGLALVVLAIVAHSIALVITAIAVMALALGAAALVQSALSGIYEAALYHFATTGEGTTGFDSGSLRLAFAPK